MDLSGKVYSDNPKINSELLGIELFAKYADKVVSKTIIDKSGHYQITINVGLSNGLNNTYDFYITRLGIDTSFIKAFRQFQGEEMTWDIKLPSTLKKKAGRTVCPKCELTDKVYPIIYGNKQIEEQKIEHGDTTYTNIVGKKYYAGTCVYSLLSPHWYCDRDKIKF